MLLLGKLLGTSGNSWEILVFEDKVGLDTEESHAVNTAYFPRGFIMLYE